MTARTTVPLLAAALLLLTPGFFTDAVGIALLLPPVRALIAPLLLRWAQRRGNLSFGGMGAGGSGGFGFSYAGGNGSSSGRGGCGSGSDSGDGNDDERGIGERDKVLEAADDNGVVMVVRGGSTGQLGRVVARDKTRYMATVQLIHNEDVLSLDYDDVCEYVGLVPDDE